MTVMEDLQARILSAANQSGNIDFNGSLHVLADLYNVGAGDVAGRTIGVSRQLDSSISSASPALNYLLYNPGAVPTMGLNFLNSTTLDSRVTFARADAVTCATYFDNTGRLTTAAANVARFDYDPSTLLPRGLLIEESRQNLLLQSRDMTTASWTKTDVTPARTQVGLDGVANTACLMTEGSAGTAYFTQGGTVSAGAAITYSIVAKRGNTDWIKVMAKGGGSTNGGNAWFNLATGVVSGTANEGTGTGTTASITNLGGGWYRCTVSSIPDGTYTLASGWVNSATASGSSTRVSGATYIVDCAQLEVGAFATSIIPTTTTALTRAADSASMTGTNFSSWFNASAGTFVAEADTPAPTAGVQKSACSADDGTLNNRLETALASNGQGRWQVVSGGVIQSDINGVGTVVAANVAFKIATTYAANSFQAALNTTLGTEDPAGTVPTVTQLVIGNRGGGGTVLNGHIRSLRYYPTRLANATLQSLTL